MNIRTGARMGALTIQHNVHNVSRMLSTKDRVSDGAHTLRVQRWLAVTKRLCRQNSAIASAWMPHGT
jgi:hypothetical protein